MTPEVILPLLIKLGSEPRSRSLALTNQRKLNQTAQQNVKRDLSLTKQRNDKCQRSDCERPTYKKGCCKHHFCNSIRSTLKKELRNIFRAPEKAYSSMDFYGKGYITELDFLNSLVMQRILFTRDEVQEFFKQYNLFNKFGDSDSAAANGMNYDQFKKLFFPQLFLINEDQESDDDRQEKQNKKNLKFNKDKQSEIITDRLKKVEKILKDKLSNNWESVRKAFLALDSDYDGYITVEDILRHFGQEKDVNYNDLKKLIMDKDSKKQGKIGYTDFSKWVGNSIHQSEGFYFRHDSIKNPQFEQNLQRNEQNNMNKSKQLAQVSMNNQHLEKTVLDKIKFQWKTLRKAFMDLNMEKSGQILPEELKFYFQHWGLNLTDDQFKYLFDKFDMDKDGKISYKDFQLTVGSEIHPAEGLYFRQDKQSMSKIESCKHDKCWQAVASQNYYCSLHLKLHQDECLKLFEKMFKSINKKWGKFIKLLKAASDPDDQSQIFMDQFVQILKKFKVDLTDKEQMMLLQSFPGRDEGLKKRVNIAKLYDQRYNMMLQKLYQKVDVHDNDGEDDPVDQSGYTGQFYRPQNKALIPITEYELVTIINKNNKLAEIIRTIKEIDKQHNGFITTTELDDILKINYKAELANRDLKHIMKKYASIQNRVLLDYKKFRDSIIQQLKQLNSGYTYGGTESSLSPQKTYNDSTAKKAKDSRVFEALNKFLTQKIDKSKIKTPPHGAITLNDSVEKKPFQSMHQSSRNQDVINLKELMRPKTRDPLTKRHFLRTDFNQSIIKSNALLNQTVDIQSDSLQTKLRLKKLSAFEVDGNNYGDLNLTQDYNQDLRRAQSQNGYVGLLQRSNTQGNGVGPLLRKRRHIKTGASDHHLRNLSLNHSKAYMDYVPDSLDNSTIKINHFLTNKKSEQVNSLMYQTLSSSNQQVSTLKFKQILKTKLQYEWKNIFRLLSVVDKKGNSTVSVSDFEHAIHQSGAFLTKEDVNKISKIYGETDGQINYQKISTDLGLHQTSFNFLKTQHLRQQNIQKLRNLYSSSEKKNVSTTLSQHSKMSLFTSGQETSKDEVKDILLKKIKQFKDLISIYQRKNHNDSPIIPITEFRTVLKGLGIHLNNQSLNRFLVNKVNEEDTKRSKSNQNFYATVGVTGIGVDAKEFLRYYV